MLIIKMSNKYRVKLKNHKLKTRKNCLVLLIQQKKKKFLMPFLLKIKIALKILKREKLKNLIPKLTIILIKI